MKIKNRYVIGTHVMWYEIEMYKDFIDGLVNLLQPVENKENVTIDLCLNVLEHFEKIDTEKIKREDILNKFRVGIYEIEKLGVKVNFDVVGLKKQDGFYLHTDYR